MMTETTIKKGYEFSLTYLPNDTEPVIKTVTNEPTIETEPTLTCVKAKRMHRLGNPTFRHLTKPNETVWEIKAARRGLCPECKQSIEVGQSITLTPIGWCHTRHLTHPQIFELGPAD